MTSVEQRQVKIAPSLLAADMSQLKKEIDEVTAAGADWLHVDVMDGHFVPNLTFGPPVIRFIKQASDLPLDVHLMITNAEDTYQDYIDAGASLITFHIEAVVNPRALIQKLRDQKVMVGVSLKPNTALASIWPLLDCVDLVLVMTVEPGFGGQSFLMDQVAKMSELRREIDRRKLKVIVEVDGGVNESTVGHCVGADVLVAGSYVFKGDYRQRITQLKEKWYESQV